MDATEYELLLSEAETRLDRLRALYEQYFQGIERIEPLVARKEVDRRITMLRRGKPKNTALRFRFNSLLQKYTTYQNYWRRVVRQIEEGTYRRHLDRVRAKKQPALAPAPAAIEQRAPLVEAVPQTGVRSVIPDRLPPVLQPPSSLPPVLEKTAPKPSLTPFARSSRPAPGLAQPSGGRQKGPPPPPRPPVPKPPAVPSPAASGVARPAAKTPGPLVPSAGKRPPPPPRVSSAASGTGDEGAIRKVFDEYVRARRDNNQRTEHLRYESVAKKLKNMLPELQKKHRGKKIEFKVVVKDGKVGFKPVAR